METFIRDSYSEFNDLGRDAQDLRDREEDLQFRTSQEEKFNTFKISIFSQTCLTVGAYTLILTFILYKCKDSLRANCTKHDEKETGDHTNAENNSADVNIQVETDRIYYTTLGNGN